MSKTVLGFFLLLVLQVWANPLPGIEDAAFINQGQDLMAEESSAINWQVPLVRHRRHPYHRHHGWDHGWDRSSEHHPKSDCHHGGFGFGFGPGPWPHHGPPHPYGFGGPPGQPPANFEPTPPYKTKLAPFNDGSNEQQPSTTTSTTPTAPAPPPTLPSSTPQPPPPTMPTTTPTLSISSTESDKLDIDIRIGT